MSDKILIDCRVNSLVKIYPVLADEWHPLLNGILSPNIVRASSNIKIWWKCRKGHEWQATPHNRKKGSGCPYCSGRRATPQSSLAAKYPKLIKEWHFLKNVDSSPEAVTPNSSIRVWWRCQKGHEWQARVRNRVQGTGCPFCVGKRVTSENSLAVNEPHIAIEWHPSKNGSFLPSEVARASNKKYWWICQKGHEWQASPNARSSGGNCPFCAGKRVCPENSLAVNAPHIAKEWHPSKNGQLSPADVTLHSNKRFWWICKKGHEWKTSVTNRVYNKGCPYCAGNIVAPDTCLLATHPRLSKDWHPTLNGKLTPAQVSKGTNKKVWWMCSRGHEWQASVHNRSRDRNCPICHPKTSTIELQLYAEIKYLFPMAESRYLLSGIEVDIYIPEFNIAIEYDGAHWHSDNIDRDEKKNKALSKINVLLIRLREEGLQAITPDDIICKKKDIYGETINFSIMKLVVQRILSSGRLDLKAQLGLKTYLMEGKLKNTGYFRKLREMLPSPPLEKSLVKLNPTLASSWHPIKNGALGPENFTPMSHTKAWWRCPRDHEWQASIAGRSKGNGCPICSNRRFYPRYHLSLADKYPLIASQWHPSKNANNTPETVAPNFAKRVWWLCHNGHEWQATPNNRVRGTGCPYCSGRLASSTNSIAARYSKLTKEWHSTKNGSMSPSLVTAGSGLKVWWICEKGHEWEAVVHTRAKGSGCPYCSGLRATEENSLATLRPDISAQWHPKRNSALLPAHVKLGSNMKVWWLCPLGHEWEAPVYKVVEKGGNCPYCSGRRVTE